MTFLRATITSIALCYVAGLFLPWWSIAICTFITSLIFRQRPLVSFLSGFLAVFLLWTSLAMIIDIQNNSILSSRIASVLPLSGSPFLLILVTGFIGGIVGGMGAGAAHRNFASYVNARTSGTQRP